MKRVTLLIVCFLFVLSACQFVHRPDPERECLSLGDVILEWREILASDAGILPEDIDIIGTEELGCDYYVCRYQVTYRYPDGMKFVKIFSHPVDDYCFQYFD